MLQLWQVGWRFVFSSSAHWANRALALAAILSSISITVAKANIIGADDRYHPPRIEGTTLEGIGILKSIPDDGGWGTAFVVGNGCYIMTAFHVAFPVRNGVRVTPSSDVKSEFHVMQNERQFSFKRKYTARPWRWGHMGLDYAILELENCRVGELPRILAQTPGVGATIPENLIPAGYPGDRAHEAGIMIQTNCTTRLPGPSFNFAYTDCDSLSGMSGAPVIVRRRLNQESVQLTNVVVGMILGVQEAAPNRRTPEFTRERGTFIMHMDPVMPWVNNLNGVGN